MMDGMTYPALPSSMRPMFHNKHAVIAGSAPGVKAALAGYLSTAPDDDHVFVAANGGIEYLTACGVKSSMLFTTAYMFRGDRQPHEQRAINAILAAGDIPRVNLYIQGDDTTIPPTLSMVAQSLFRMRESYRLRIVEQVTDQPLRVSTGVYAVCQVLTEGANRVTVLGVNVRSKGHEGGGNAPRDHVNEDRTALREITKRYNVRLI